uniref:Bro-b n=1 Tax=Lymantria dispar multicapsid nuclear polyhedrosis virus TaxID=10449 RepID=A0A140IKT9_NPVLD|nr:bro-b [Lymantria dispar multiple nucleopolyhedrovirus]
MMSSGLNSIDPCRHVKSYASAELEFRHDVIGLNSIAPCRHVKSYASAELSLGVISSGSRRDVVGPSAADASVVFGRSQRRDVK